MNILAKTTAVTVTVLLLLVAATSWGGITQAQKDDLTAKVNALQSAIGALVVDVPVPPPPPPPPPPPAVLGTVSDLKATVVGATFVTLTFTEVPDGAGGAATYDLRYSPAPISWGSATSLPAPLAGTSVGAVRTVVVQGLIAGTAYQFQIVAYRGTPNVNAVFGALSGVVSATTTVAVVPPPPPPVSSTWSHEPAGFVQMNNQPWDALSSLGWGHLNRGAQSRIVADSTAPLSPANVLEHVYPVGFSGGVEPAVDWFSLPAGFTEGFVGMWWKASNPWQGHPTGVNKIYFLFGGAAGNIVPVMYGPPGGPYELRVAPEQGNWSWLTPNITNVPITLGVWHKIELYFKQSGGLVSIRWWMDGTLLGDYTGVPFPGALQELQIAPTWGGIGGTKSEDDSFRFDHVYVSRP